MNLSKVRAAGWLLLALVTSADAGTNRWTEAGPNVATITRVEFAAGSNTVAFARGGDKFWKSVDAGATWDVLQRDNTQDFVFALDRSDPNILLLSGPTGALLRSTNAGETYSAVTSVYSPYALAFGTDGVVYASQLFTPKIVRSADRGLTWSAVSETNLPVTGTTNSNLPLAYSIAVDPTNSNRVYLGYQHPDFPGIYRSTDGGATWLTSTGLAGIRVYAIAIDPATPSRLFVATAMGVYVSNDSGATWAKVTDPTGSGVATIDMWSIAIDPTQPQVIYAGGTWEGQMFRSTDGGATWSRRGNGLFASGIRWIAPRPGVSGDVLAATTHTMFRTTDGGANWATSATGIRGASISSIQSGTKLRIGLFDGGVYESSDRRTWTPINNAGLRDRVPTRRLSSVAGIYEGTRLFVILEQDGVFASTDSGATWLPQPDAFYSYSRYSFGAFITERGSGPVHYLGTLEGLFKTMDDGNTWVNSSAGITIPNSLTSIRALAKNTDGTQLFAGTFNGGLFKSTDGGASWSAINNGLTSLEIRKLAYDNSGSNALIVGTSNGLFVTRDAGASYTRLPDLMGMQASVEGIVVEDFLRGSLYVASQGRVFRSVDSGQTWIELAEANPVSAYRYITAFGSDGPGVLYTGSTYVGLHEYTVSPDLEVIAQPPAAGSFAVGTQFNWSARVRNNGPHAATFSRLTWSLGPNINITSVTPARGQCSVAAQTVNCDFGIIQANSMVDVSVAVQGTANGPVTIQASASAAERDMNAANNTFTDSSVVIQDAPPSQPTPPSNSGGGGGGGGVFDPLFTLLGLMLVRLLTRTRQ